MANFLGPFVPIPSPTSLILDSSPVGGSARSNSLGFVMQQQMGNFWCWAAATSSVSAFYDARSAWTQCSIADACLMQACCASPISCDRPFVLDAPLTRTGNLQGTPFTGVGTRQQIQDEIDAGRVVCCFIDWGDQSGHFVAISGYDWGTDDLVIDDSLYQRSTVPYPVFTSSYLSKGSWRYTYLTEA